MTKLVCSKKKGGVATNVYVKCYRCIHSKKRFSIPGDDEKDKKEIDRPVHPLKVNII